MYLALKTVAVYTDKNSAVQ